MNLDAFVNLFAGRECLDRVTGKSIIVNTLNHYGGASKLLLSLSLFQVPNQSWLIEIVKLN